MLCEMLQWRWQVLASAGDDGSVHLWDLRRLRLLHVLQVHPHTRAPAGASPSGRVVAMQIKEETGELALATHDQLQLWSINAALLAVRAHAATTPGHNLLLRGSIAPVLACR